MEHITNHPWFWPVVIFGGIIGILLLIIRIIVVGYKEYGPASNAPKWQRRLLAFVCIVGLSVVMAMYLETFPFYVTFIVATWIGWNAAFVPQEVSWKTAFLYTFQLIGTAIIMFMILRVLLVN
jgi:cytochrome b561